MPGQQQQIAARVLVAACLLAAAGVAQARVTPADLVCGDTQPAGVQDHCTARGAVTAGQNITYIFNVDEYADLDVVVTLTPLSGDADLAVDSPDGLQYASKHGGGNDQVFISRDYVYSAAGEYVITVMGYTDTADYSLTVETFESPRTASPDDRAALQELLDGPCCQARGACPALRKSLAAKPSVDMMGDALCYDGVTLCDPSGRVVQLSLVNQFLECPFPAVLGKLTSLAALDLNYNSITGGLDTDVTAAIQKLPKLQNLVLSNNRLGGSLSCEMVGASLAELDITGNQVAGSIPACVVNSPAMREVYLSGNKLSGALPTLAGNNDLLIISASSQALSGPIPDMSSLGQLVALQLANNQLIGMLPALPTSVRNVQLEGNRLSGPIPEQWAALRDLTVLRLGDNDIAGSVPAGLATLPKLEILLLSGNQLTGSLPSTWDAPVLERAELQDNKLSGALPADIARSPRLALFNAGNNQLSGTLDAFGAAAAAASSDSNLKSLILSGNELNGGVPESLKALPVFKGGFVVLDDTVSGAILDLSSNQLDGLFPAWVVNELATSSASVLLAGNELTCPFYIYTPNPVPPSNLKGLTCINSNGAPQLVAPLATTTLPSPPAQQQPDVDAGQQVPGATDNAPTSAPEGSSDSSASSTQSQGDAGVAAWVIALTCVAGVLGVLALAFGAYLCWRQQRATHCQQRPGSGDGTMDKLGLAGKDSAAADKVAAKGEAAAAVARSSSSFRIGTQVAEQV